MLMSHRFAIELQRRLQRLVHDQRGVSAVEFALILPLMLTLYLGTVEVSDGVALDRKVMLSARSVADMVAQAATVSCSDTSDILTAATSITEPYDPTPLKVTVSELQIDPQLNVTVVWSDSKNVNPHSPGDVITTLPAGLKVANTYLIWGEVQYAYKPVIGYVLTGTFTLHEQIYMRPRQSASVTHTC